MLAARFAARSVQCAQIPFSMATSRFIAHAHAAGLQVHAWTVNDPAVMTRLLDLGVDGIMTDQTEALRDVLVSAGSVAAQNRRLGGHFRQISVPCARLEQALGRES